MNEKNEIDTEKEIKKEAVDPKEKSKEDKPILVVRPSCTMELVPNKETDDLEVVYSEKCSGKMIRDVAGKLALDGVKFRPAKEKKLSVKEEIAALERHLLDLKKQRHDLDLAAKLSSDEPAAGPSEKPSEKLSEKPSEKSSAEPSETENKD